MIEQSHEIVIIEQFRGGDAGRRRCFAFRKKCQRARNFTAQIFKQSEFIVGRDAERTGNRRALAFFRQDATEKGLAGTAVERFGLLRQGERQGRCSCIC